MFLQVDAVSKRFGNVQAVNDVSFTCREGELTAILGPSGCGKTTLLRLVAGFESADAGDIRLAGRSLLSKAPEHRHVGMIFQNYALFPHMNVAANIAYGLRYSQRPWSRHKIDTAVRDLLQLVDLAGYGERFPDELSAGQQQRVAIARALAPQPKLLLLDEPLSALDVSLREQLRLKIRRWQRELGLTALYVTHDQEEAMAIADRIAVMSDGRLEQFATPQNIYEVPKTPFVATFFGRTALVSTTHFPPNTRFSSGVPAHNGKAVIRSERVRLDGSGIPLHGVLDDVEYLGQFVRLHVRGSFGTVWAQAPAEQIGQWQNRLGREISIYIVTEHTPVVHE